MNLSDQRLEFLIRDLPSPESARRFWQQFSERDTAQAARVRKNEGLLSDILTLAAYSPLLGTTLIQNPEYAAWLGSKRARSKVQEKDELLESLARFALTNSQLEPNVMLARFRRRELISIFLRDIRQLGTIAEITEEISNLADAILEQAVRLARQEMDNRYGQPLEIDEKGRQKRAEACVVSLGKLGSKELNYSSDIDLLFIYSSEGSTSGSGSRGSVSNREYFAKFAQAVTQLVGRQTGEGAAYRVDMRLRPHGRVGALALTLKETVRYYLTEARSWEQQVLIRSRASAGNATLYKSFFSQVEETVFRKGRDANEALREVLLSKEKIDRTIGAGAAFDVKLGQGGIREIEFIAQALQLAYGGSDPWLRVPHTLISISRLADRGYLTEDERSALSNAYDFLRRLEHVIQMEHGLQTHLLPVDDEKLSAVSAKMGRRSVEEFKSDIDRHRGDVHRTFRRVFGTEANVAVMSEDTLVVPQNSRDHDSSPEPSATEQHVLSSVEKHSGRRFLDVVHREIVHRISETSPRFAEMISSRPWLIEHLSVPSAGSSLPDYESAFAAAVDPSAERSVILNQMRSVWSRHLLDIVTADVYRVIPLAEARHRQTLLAEASIRTALEAASGHVAERFAALPSRALILAVGKLGSGTLDYDSDLDIIIAHPDDVSDTGINSHELYSRAAELFVTFLSGVTRDGSLYRVDLRLRPHGKSGPNVTSINGLTEYIRSAASIWELLAYVQIRAVGTDTERAQGVEAAITGSIRERTGREEREDIRRLSRDMRLKLEAAHTRRSSGPDTNIKFGAGGLLDVYFVVRYLHLTNLDSVGDSVRSTSARLDAFLEAGLLSGEDHAALRSGHDFLSALDHNIRLAIGRSQRLPRGNPAVLEKIAERLDLGSAEDMLQQLALHRISIRSAFDRVLGAQQ